MQGSMKDLFRCEIVYEKTVLEGCDSMDLETVLIGQMQRLTARVGGKATANTVREQLYSLRHTIHLEPERDWHIKETASRLGLSESYLQHLYRTEFSVSLTNDVIHARVEKAKRLLTKTDLLISEVAELCDDQRWSIDGVEKDPEGYMLYYKVTASDGTALTFSPESNSLSTEDYAGDTYQKSKLDLDGLQGYAANCIVDGKEKAGTIGGLLGDTVFVSTPDEMKTAMAKDEPLTIVMTKDMGSHPYGQVEIKSNKTLTSYYGLTLKDCQLRTAPTDTDQAPYDDLVFRKRSYQNSNNDCKQYRSYIKRVLFSVIGKWHSFIVSRLTVLFRSDHFMFRIRHCHLKIFNGST